MSANKMVILVAVDIQEHDVAWATTSLEFWEKWTNDIETIVNKDGHPINDRFGLFFGGHDSVDTWDSFDAAMTHVAEAEAQIVGIHACLSY